MRAPCQQPSTACPAARLRSRRPLPSVWTHGRPGSGSEGCKAAGGGDTSIGLGALLVFGSALSYAVYLVASGELVRRLGSLRLVGLAT